MRIACVVVLAACTGGGESQAELFRGDVWGGNIAASDGMAYWTTYNEGGEVPNEIGLYAAPLDGSAGAVRLSVGNSHGIPGFGMAVAGGRVFWSGALGNGASGAGVFGDSITSGDRTQVAQFSTGEAPRGVAVDSQFVYASGSELIRIPLAGGAQETIGSPVHWLAHVDDELILERDGVISRRTSATGDEQVLTTVAGVTGNLVIDGNTIYVPATAAIIKIARDTGMTSTLEVGGMVSEIAVAGDVVFAFRQIETSEIVRLPASGGPTELVVADPGALGSMVIADRDLLYARCSCGPVGGANGAIERIPF